MPIVNRPSNNRILPTNTRSVDVARQSIDRITGIQAKRYDNAFQVQGFQAVLYNKLKCGVTCMCQTKASKVPKSLLDEDGNAGPGVINKLLTGQKFGSLPYGAMPDNSNPFAPLEGGGFGAGTVFTDDEASIYSKAEPVISKPFYGSPSIGFAEEDDLEMSNTDVIIQDGFSDAGPVSGAGTEAKALFDSVLDSGLDFGFDASSDVACPICFGTGYVGGFSVYNGFRAALDSQMLDTSSINNGVIDLDPFVPTITGSRITFKPVTLPMGCVRVDALNVYNGSNVLSASIFVDGTLITSEQQLSQYCDGRPHVFSVFAVTAAGQEEPIITHLEIQYNQSTKDTLFEFPKLSQGSVETLLERTDAFQIMMSPVIPNITGGDIITDSTYGKVMQITTSNWWNDKRRAVLGWDCNVRPCQPQELYSILPKRRPFASQNTASMVRSNTDKRF